MIRIGELNEQLTKIRSKLELLDRQTTRYRELEKEAMHVVQDLSYERQKATEELNGKKAQFYEQILGEIRAAIGRFGTENDYTVILQKEFTLTTEAQSWKSVLYHGAETDLTDTILAVLNRG